MTIDLLRQFHAKRHQDDRPDDRVEPHDFFADQMNVSRPVAGKFLRIMQIAGSSDIVGQGVKPDINDMFAVKRHRDAPVEGRAGHAEIFQSLFDEIDHFVAAGHRLDKLGILFDMFQQPFLVFGHPEKITLFLDPLDRSAAIGAVAFSQLAFQPESFAGRTVPAFISGFVDIALIKDFLKDRLYHFVMACFGRADEIVMTDAEFFPQHLERSHDLVDVLDRAQSVFRRLTLDFLAMFVRPCQKEDVAPGQALESGHGIGNGRAIGMSDMQSVTRVVNRGADKKRLFVHFVPPVSCPLPVDIFVIFRKPTLAIGNNRLTFGVTIWYF